MIDKMLDRKRTGIAKKRKTGKKETVK